MRLNNVVTSREATTRTFRSAVENERDVWRDDKYLAVHDRHLTPLIAENARFDRELAAIMAVVIEANRRLEESQ